MYKEKEKDEEPLRLALKDRSGYLTLSIVDKEGNTAVGGNLLQISSNGEFMLFSRIPPRFGLDLDSKGRINVK